VRASSAWFGDGTAKIYWRLRDRTSVSIDGIYADDYFRYGTTFGYAWTTKAGGITVKHALTKKLFLEGHYGLSDLSNRFFDQGVTTAFALSGGLLTHTGHLHTKYVPREGVSYLFGLQYLLSEGKEQALDPLDSRSAILSKRARGSQGRELAVFAEGDLKITSKWNLKAGLRAVQYAQLGPGSTLTYEPGFIDLEHVIDTINYGRNAQMADYQSIEPRISVSYQVSEHSSIKGSYTRMQQFLHLISNTIGATPADVWQPSTRFIKPQIGDNFSLGWATNFTKTKKELNVEAFYKWTSQLPIYKDFANLLLNENLETELITGQAKSYGAEISYRKNRGRFQYSGAYTWSRLFQRAAAPNPLESVNNGQWFPGLIDQPHQLTLLGKLYRNPINYLTASFTYRTGKPFSAPRSGYAWGQTVIPFYDGRNNLRIPDYHRLDIAYTFDQSKSKLKGLKYILQFSIYNVYSRDNALSVFFKRNENGTAKAFQFATIGAAIPAVQLTFIL
jgi:TonB dependent receptor